MAKRHSFVEPGDAFDELSDVVIASQPLDAVLTTLVELSKAVLPALAGASITLLDDEKPTTAAFSGQVALDLDERQYASGDGPCLHAARSGQLVEVPDVGEESRWPEFTAVARAVGVASSLSVPLRDPRAESGALNLYARAPGVFDESTIELAQTFAGHAAVAVANARLYESTATLARQMREAMKSRAAIEQAKGILMASRACTSQEAFEVLVKLSQRSQMKLREVAERFVEEAASREDGKTRQERPL